MAGQILLHFFPVKNLELTFLIHVQINQINKKKLFLFLSFLIENLELSFLVHLQTKNRLNQCTLGHVGPLWNVISRVRYWYFHFCAPRGVPKLITGLLILLFFGFLRSLDRKQVSRLLLWTFNNKIMKNS